MNGTLLALLVVCPICLVAMLRVILVRVCVYGNKENNGDGERGSMAERDDLGRGEERNRDEGNNRGEERARGEEINNRSEGRRRGGERNTSAGSNRGEERARGEEREHPPMITWPERYDGRAVLQQDVEMQPVDGPALQRLSYAPQSVSYGTSHNLTSETCMQPIVPDIRSMFRCLFSVTNGSLPPSLVLNPRTGVISGIPLGKWQVTLTITATNYQGSCAAKVMLKSDFAPRLPVARNQAREEATSSSYDRDRDPGQKSQHIPTIRYRDVAVCKKYTSSMCMLCHKPGVCIP